MLNDETLLDPVRSSTCCTPKDRMLVLHAEPYQRADGVWEALGNHYQVAALVTVTTKDGKVHPTLAIIVDGELTTLEEARQLIWEPGSLDEVVICDWPPHCDTTMLGRRLKKMCKMAIAQAKEGGQVAVGPKAQGAG